MDVAAELYARRNVLTLVDALDVGISAIRIERLAKSGVLTRVGRGVYASTVELANSDPWKAHATRTRGYLRACGADTFAAEWSAVAVRDLRRLGKPPDLPTVVKARSPSQDPRKRHGTHRTAHALTRTVPLDPRYFGQYAGCPVLDKAWLVVDLARTASPMNALVVADAAVGSGATHRGMRRALETMKGWNGTDAAAWIIDRADERCESTLETLGRFTCIKSELPIPVSNAWVGAGRPRFRVDHFWPWHGVVGEADGATKYNDADAPANVVAAEKERQWYLERELGFDVIRYDWDIAFHDRLRLAGRIANVLAANPARPEPSPWWPINSPFVLPVLARATSCGGRPTPRTQPAAWAGDVRSPSPRR